MSLAAIYPSTLHETVRLTNKSSGRAGFRGPLICLDPGETTGWAIFKDNRLRDCGQWKTKDRAQAAIDLSHAIEECQGKYGTADVRVVMEDYRMYGWKKDEHTFSVLHTPKLIGAYEAACAFTNSEYTMQMAVTAKGFATDGLLEHWGYWQSGLRHARDAIRHGIYYLMFDKGQSNKEAPAHVGSKPPEVRYPSND